MLLLIKKAIKRMLSPNSRIQSPHGYRIVGDPANVKLGTSVSFGGNVLLYAVAPIVIGDYSMLAVNTIVHTATHNSELHPMWMERINRPVSIGKHVWIGVGAIICPGVRIGDYSIIGAGSVITKHVPDCAVVVGNPARILRFRKISNETLSLPVDPAKAKEVNYDFLSDEKETKRLG